MEVSTPIKIGFAVLFVGVVVFVVMLVSLAVSSANKSAAYEISKEQLKLQEKRQEQVEKSLASLDKEVKTLEDTQKNALEQIEKDGYIHTSDGHNPKWMHTYQTGGDK